MPLYGHELDREHSPIEAGLGFAVGKKGGFIGADTLDAQRTNGTQRQLIGLQLEGRRPARAEYPVIAGADASSDSAQVIGTVTSGAPSPTIGAPIAMAYVSSDFAAIGTAIAVDIRGKAIPATVVELPFYRREK